jgi:predicted phosphodiesterase
MRILAIADEPARELSESFDADRWRSAGIELVVSCGDLDIEYIAFVADALRVPLAFIRGNHDDRWNGTPGGEDLDGRLFLWKGLRFLGLSGSYWYNGGDQQYSEAQTRWRVLKATPAIMLHGGVDVVVGHAPPQFCEFAYRLCKSPVGVGRICPYRSTHESPFICQDASDKPHRGFVAYRTLIERYSPAVFLHGHVHRSFGVGKRELRLDNTRIIDAHRYVIVDV